MRIAVAGSSGLIGTALVDRLRRGRHEVVRLVRGSAHAADEIGWDPVSGYMPTSLLSGMDALVNLCGVSIGGPRWTGARKQLIRDSRIESTAVLAREVAAAGIPTMINASACGFYGDTGDRTVDESAPAGSGFLADVCVDWEAATAPAAEAGTRVVLCRSGVVLSRRGGMLGPLRALYRLGLGGRLGAGRQYLSWISLEDEVRAIEFLLAHAPGSAATADATTDGSPADAPHGPVNLTGPAPVTNSQFNSALGRILHRPTPLVVPSIALRIALGEFAGEGILAGQRAIPRELERFGFEFRHPTIGSALDAALSP